MCVVGDTTNCAACVHEGSSQAGSCLAVVWQSAGRQSGRQAGSLASRQSGRGGSQAEAAAERERDAAFVLRGHPFVVMFYCSIMMMMMINAHINSSIFTISSFFQIHIFFF